MVIHETLFGDDKTIVIYCPREKINDFNRFYEGLEYEYNSHFFKTSSLRKNLKDKLLKYCIENGLDTE